MRQVSEIQMLEKPSSIHREHTILKYQKSQEGQAKDEWLRKISCVFWSILDFSC